MGSTPLEEQINAARAVTATDPVPLDKQLRQAEAENTEIAALGVNLEAMARQYAQDQREAAQDKVLMDQLLARAEAPDTPPAELRQLLAQSQDALARARARRFRRERYEEDLAAVARIQATRSQV
ncbi:hypothetical protein ACLF6K_07180 [Streptomyces xanthophaeus]|uniref:hypothetical protein n=1 Tax=Streptomyces xanthophaeus TaxID=67385 RepID=UPI00398F9E56